MLDVSMLHKNTIVQERDEETSTAQAVTF